MFHKIITSGLPRLQPLYDCLLTIMVNSECPYSFQFVDSITLTLCSLFSFSVPEDSVHGHLCKTNASHGGTVNVHVHIYTCIFSTVYSISLSMYVLLNVIYTS